MRLHPRALASATLVAMLAVTLPVSATNHDEPHVDVSKLSGAVLGTWRVDTDLGPNLVGPDLVEVTVIRRDFSHCGHGVVQETMEFSVATMHGKSEDLGGGGRSAEWVHLVSTYRGKYFVGFLPQVGVETVVAGAEPGDLFFGLSGRETVGGTQTMTFSGSGPGEWTWVGREDCPPGDDLDNLDDLFPDGPGAVPGVSPPTNADLCTVCDAATYYLTRTLLD